MQFRFREMSAMLVASTAMLCVGSARADDLSPALAKLVAAANAEGKLDISWGPNTISDSQDMENVGTAMAKAWGSTVEVHFTPGPSMPEIGHQIAMELSAGQKAVTDLYYAAGSYVAPLLGRDVFVKVDWKALLPDRITDNSFEADGRLLRLYTGMSGITYNTSLVPYVPTTLADLLKPEWTGKFASTPYAAGFDTLSGTDVWGPEKTLDYVRKLSKQISGLIRCNEIERVASGEYVAMAMDCSGQAAATWKVRGAPVDQAVPLDAAQFRYYYLAVPRNSAHPNAATLFALFLQTPTGQSMLWDLWHCDLHFYPESHMGQLAGKLEAQGAKFSQSTTDWILAHPEVAKTTAEAIKILTSK